MTSSGIEPATFRLIVYCLYQLRYLVPSSTSGTCKLSLYNVESSAIDDIAVKGPDLTGYAAVDRSRTTSKEILI
jgi:hypothetical protein